MSDTGFGGDDLNNYIFYNSVMDHSNGKLLVGLNNAIINFNGNNNRWKYLEFLFISNKTI